MISGRLASAIDGDLAKIKQLFANGAFVTERGHHIARLLAVFYGHYALLEWMLEDSTRREGKRVELGMYLVPSQACRCMLHMLPHWHHCIAEVHGRAQ